MFLRNEFGVQWSGFRVQGSEFHFKRYRKVLNPEPRTLNPFFGCGYAAVGWPGLFVQMRPMTSAG